MGRKSNIERDLSIAAALAAGGTSASELARRHGLSAKRIYNIGSQHRNGHAEGAIILAQEQEKAAAAERRAATAESRAHAEIQRHYQGDMLVVSDTSYKEGWVSGYEQGVEDGRRRQPLESQFMDLNNQLKQAWGQEKRQAALNQKINVLLDNGLEDLRREMGMRYNGNDLGGGVSSYRQQLIDAGLLPPPPGRPGRRR